MINRENLNIGSCMMLLAAIIHRALIDLYEGDESQRYTAEWFFKHSPLFKASGLDFEYLKRKYLENK